MPRQFGDLEKLYNEAKINILHETQLRIAKTAPPTMKFGEMK